MRTPSYFLTYGMLKTGYKVWSNQRADTYHPKDTRGSETVEVCFTAGKDDFSPRVTDFQKGEYHRRYDARCSHCYLNNLHTINLHDQRITDI